MRLKLLSLSVMAMGSVAGMLSSPVLASGYNFGSQSVSAQGTSHANGAEAADPSTIYYNPAGMSLLDGDQITVGATALVPHSSYTDSGSTTQLGSAPGGGNGGRYAPDAVVAPSLYMTHQVNDQVRIGLGVFVPYGAELNYGDSWVGRYALESVKLQTLNFNPSISFKFDDHQSFGFGVSAQYMDASLQRAVDVTSATSGLFGALADGTARFDAHSWGYGFNLGYMYMLDEHTRFGLAYRSKITEKLSGSASWDFSQDPAGLQPLLYGSHSTSAASSSVDTPQSVSANFYHDLDARWAVMGNVTWTGHSALDEIDIKFNGTNEGDMVLNQQWKNTWQAALGANYKYSDSLLLRTGIAYDQSPVPNDQLRDPALPDSDRYWLSLGANYKFSKQSSVDLAYSYVFFKDANINYVDNCSVTSTTCTGNGETTKGAYKTSLQVIGVSYNYRF